MPQTLQIGPDPVSQTELASGARSATYVGPDKIQSEMARGVMVVLDLTAFTTAASLQVAIEVFDVASGKYVDLLAATAVTATGTFAYIVAPGATAAGGGVTKSVSAWLQKQWRIRVIHGNANSHTYSVGFAYLA